MYIDLFFSKQHASSLNFAPVTPAPKFTKQQIHETDCIRLPSDTIGLTPTGTVTMT